MASGGQFAVSPDTARYAEAAAYLAAARDGPGMAHALGCAGRALLAASQAAATLRPARMEAAR